MVDEGHLIWQTSRNSAKGLSNDKSIAGRARVVCEGLDGKLKRACPSAQLQIVQFPGGGGAGGWAIGGEGAGGGRGPKVLEGLFCHMNYGPVL